MTKLLQIKYKIPKCYKEDKLNDRIYNFTVKIRRVADCSPYYSAQQSQIYVLASSLFLPPMKWATLAYVLVGKR
jgi:hypothetical protein